MVVAFDFFLLSFLIILNMKRSDCELYRVGFSHAGYSRHQVQSQRSMTVCCWWSGFLTGLSRTCVLAGFSSQWPRLGQTCFHLQFAFSPFASLFLITFLSDWFSCMEDIPSFSACWHTSSLLGAPEILFSLCALSRLVSAWRRWEHNSLCFDLFIGWISPYSQGTW